MESCLVTQHQDGWDRASSVPAPCTTFRLRKAQQFGGPLPKHILQKRNDRAALPSNQVCRVTRTSRLSVKASQSIDQVNGSSLQKQKSPGKKLSPQSLQYNGVFALLLLNFGLFIVDKIFHVRWVAALYLNHSHPRWWQYLTAAFCHASGQHISGNAFMLLIFGRIVEEEEGTFGVLATYIFCALGASIASYLLQPRNVVSLGASGAVFGLFVVSVLCKLSLNLRKLLECAILGQFVMQQVIHEAKMQLGTRGAAIGGTSIGHLAHLFGALAGVLLVFLLSRIPAPGEE